MADSGVPPPEEELSACFEKMMEAMAIPAPGRAQMRLQPGDMKWQMYKQWRASGGGDKSSAESQKDDAQGMFNQIRVEGIKTVQTALQLATKCKTAHFEWLKTFLDMGGAGELCAQLQRLEVRKQSSLSDVDRSVQQ